jgi:quercetin 2,3-dioxygenase
MADPVLATFELGFPWQTLDPFLFCVHHDDAYPAGNEQLGPDPAELRGRNIGMDFQLRDGWRMYHGDVVPGFPRHPHRGFETITVARRGHIDHSDSLGATARFGHGDVQWMTAGRGIVHAEMFPLLHDDQPNPGELFQIWLNLPAADKFADPHFTMLWEDTIPRQTSRDDQGRVTTITAVAGRYGDLQPPSPPPSSWASRADADVAIWTLKLESGAETTLPPARPGTQRMLYFFAGETLAVAGQRVPCGNGVQVRADTALELRNGPAEAELLVLQGRPIGEPVVQHGPFVMNTSREITQAMLDYEDTGFGGWPWSRDDPVHPRDRGRFAIHADGRADRPT